jgi:peptidoglycan hydrolase CwlO-like protein
MINSLNKITSQINELDLNNKEMENAQKTLEEKIEGLKNTILLLLEPT